MGFVYERPAASVRAILGIPGSSFLGDAQTLPTEVKNIHFAPGQVYALVERGDSTPSGVINFESAGPGPLVEIKGALSKADIVSFSPNGTAAAIYSASEGRLQVLAGLPDSPQIMWEVSRTDLPDDLRLLAINDDARTLLAGTVGSAIYIFRNGTAEFLYSVADLAAMVFVPESDDMLTVDHGGGRATLLEHVSTQPSHKLLAEGVDGDVAAALDRNTAVILNSGSTTLWQIDLHTLQVQQLQLPSVPKMLQRLRTSRRYLLSYESGEPAWILDAGDAVPAIQFVPARRQERR
jgi:hypothetical protein